jgi:hypothetical protein
VQRSAPPTPLFPYHLSRLLIQDHPLLGNGTHLSARPCLACVLAVGRGARVSRQPQPAHGGERCGVNALPPRCQVAKEMRCPVENIVRVIRQTMRDIPLVAEDGPLEVLFEDRLLLAVNKPAGKGWALALSKLSDMALGM